MAKKPRERTADPDASSSHFFQETVKQLERILWQEIGEPFVQFGRMTDVFSASNPIPPHLNNSKSAQDQRSLLDFLPSGHCDHSDLEQHTMFPDNTGPRSLADLGQLKLNPSLEKHARIMPLATPRERDDAERVQMDANDRIFKLLHDPRMTPIRQKIMNILSPLDPITGGHLGYLYRLVTTLNRALPKERKVRENLLKALNSANVPPVRPFLKFQIESESLMAISQIDHARKALEQASALLKPFENRARWRKRQGKRENTHFFSHAGLALTRLFMKECHVSATKASTAATWVLCEYAPDYLATPKSDQERMAKNFQTTVSRKS